MARRLAAPSLIPLPAPRRRGRAGEPGTRRRNAMHVRASRIVTDPDSPAGDGDAGYRAMVESMKNVEGFRGAMLLSDAATGTSLGLTFWENDATLQASEEVANMFRREGAQAVGATAVPTVERFEVVYYGVPAPSAVG